MDGQTIINLANKRFPGYRFDLAYQVAGLPGTWIITSSLHGDIAASSDGNRCNLLHVEARN